MDDRELAQLAERLGETLRAQGWSLVTAESCTGGWVAKLLTDIPGSSAWFERGYVTYSNAAKQELLGVAATTLAGHGAVSEATVREMAEGALRRGHGQLSLAISGIAGPGGGSADKPVGLVWLAWATAAGVRAASEVFAGSRDAVRRQAVAAALQGALDVVSGA